MSVRISCGLYMDPPGMARHGGVAEAQRQMHAYIRLLYESLLSFRALMTSARARLIDLSASEALSHSRIWARRSDLSPHHSHTLASCGKIPVLPPPPFYYLYLRGLPTLLPPYRPAPSPSAPPRTVHQQFAEIAIAMFADAQQARFAARAVLSWNQPEPCGKLAAIFELGRII